MLLHQIWAIPAFSEVIPMFPMTLSKRPIQTMFISDMRDLSLLFLVFVFGENKPSTFCQGLQSREQDVEVYERFGRPFCCCSCVCAVSRLCQLCQHPSWALFKWKIQALLSASSSELSDVHSARGREYHCPPERNHQRSGSFPLVREQLPQYLRYCRQVEGICRWYARGIDLLDHGRHVSF